MSLQTKHIYELGPFRLDAAKHLLLRDGEALRLVFLDKNGSLGDENRLAEEGSDDDWEEEC